MERVLRAVRGAITVDEDRPEEIIEATRELTGRVMSDNGIVAEDIVSIIFTATPDLTSEFPAVGAREAGLVQTPLLCAQEIPVPGSQPRCIRLLMHVYMEKSTAPQPVYLRDAVSLRPDLAVDHGSRIGSGTGNGAAVRTFESVPTKGERDT